MLNPGMSRPALSRRTLVSLSLGLAVLTALYALRWHETPIGAVTDDAYYIEMARSVAAGLGPVIDTGPDVPATNPEIFPAGFPYLLSPLARIFPHSLTAFKAVPLMGAMLLLPLSLWLPGPGSDNRLRLMVTAVVMLNPWVVAWSGRVLSDVPFTALSLGALLLFLKLQTGTNTPRGNVLGLVVLCAVTVSVRTIGWAAVLAMSIVLLTQRRWLWAGLLPLSVVALLLPVWLLTPNSTGLLSQGYVDQMFSHHGVPLWRFALDNLVHYLGELPVVLLPLFGNPVEAALQLLHLGILYPAMAFVTGAALLLLVGVAVLRRWRNRQDSPRISLFAIYLVIYGAVLAQFDGYPSGVQTRLLIPVLPPLVWLVLWGLRELFGSDRHAMSRLVLGLMIVAALAHNGWRIARPLRTSVEAGGHGLVDPGQGAAWIVDHTRAGDVVMVQDRLQRHIHFRRPVVGVGAGDTEAVAAVIDTFGPEYLFIGPAVHGPPRRLDPTGMALLAVARHQPRMFQPVHDDPVEAIHIFRIRRP